MQCRVVDPETPGDLKFLVQCDLPSGGFDGLRILELLLVVLLTLLVWRIHRGIQLFFRRLSSEEIPLVTIV